jgi:hypothetical protein
MAALQSIYDSYFSLADSEETYEHPRAFRVKVVPHPGHVDGNFCHVVVLVKLARRYPIDAFPFIKIVEYSGITPKDKDDLSVLIDDKVATSSMGEVFVLSILSEIQDFLQPRNKEPPAGSMYEQMIVHKEQVWN